MTLVSAKKVRTVAPTSWVSQQEKGDASGKHFGIVSLPSSRPKEPPDVRSSLSHDRALVYAPPPCAPGHQSGPLSPLVDASFRSSARNARGAHARPDRRRAR